MKVLLEIKDNKVDFILELLANFSFVKVKHLSKQKIDQIEAITKAVKELKLVKEGKLEGIYARDLLNEI